MLVPCAVEAAARLLDALERISHVMDALRKTVSRHGIKLPLLRLDSLPVHTKDTSPLKDLSI